MSGERVKTGEQANNDETLSNSLTSIGVHVGTADTKKAGETYLPPRNASAYETVNTIQTKSSL